MSTNVHNQGANKDFSCTANTLKAISHPLRLRILNTVAEQEMNVRDIVSTIGTSTSNISQHLSTLRNQGILVTRKDANRVFYRVKDQRLLIMIKLMRDIYKNN